MDRKSAIDVEYLEGCLLSVREESAKIEVTAKLRHGDTQNLGLTTGDTAAHQSRQPSSTVPVDTHHGRCKDGDRHAVDWTFCKWNMVLKLKVDLQCQAVHGVRGSDLGKERWRLLAIAVATPE